MKIPIRYRGMDLQRTMTVESETAGLADNKGSVPTHTTVIASHAWRRGMSAELSCDLQCARCMHHSLRLNSSVTPLLPGTQHFTLRIHPLMRLFAEDVCNSTGLSSNVLPCRCVADD